MPKKVTRRGMARDAGRYERGLKTLAKVTGRRRGPTVRPEEPPSAEGLHRLFVEHCYGDSWSDPVLDLRTKSLVTVAVLTTLGAQRELKLHIRGAHNLGVSKDEIVALLKHLAAYCGVPRTVHATAMAQEAWREMEAR